MLHYLYLYFTGILPTLSITVSNIGMNTITTLWTNSSNDPENVCGPVMYRVIISGSDINDTNTTNNNMNTFTGLIPNTNYTITITPYNEAGDGPPNNIEVMGLVLHAFVTGPAKTGHVGTNYTLSH